MLHGFQLHLIGKVPFAEKQFFALEIAVNQQYLFAFLRQSDAEIGTGRCLSNNALLVGDVDDLCVHTIFPFLFLLYIFPKTIPPDPNRWSCRLFCPQNALPFFAVSLF